MTNYRETTVESEANQTKSVSMLKYRADNRCQIALIAALAFGATANADMGRTPGEWGVASSGAATYNVPIWVQPGPKGMQPALAIAYNSQFGNGTMGVGWSLTGLSSIDRCPKTAAEDSSVRPVMVDDQDRFCLNGNKLRITSGPVTSYGALGAVYETQIANFSRVTSVGSVATPGTGPQHFIVESKDGLIYEYGSTADSRVVLSGTTVYRWMLSKVRDRDGNSYAVTYTVNNLEGRVPLTVSWGPLTAGGSDYQYQVAFNYTLKINQKDMVFVRQGNTEIALKQRLNSITVGYSSSGSAPYSPRRQYLLSYLPSPTTSLGRLVEIKECATTISVCLKPTTIAYQNGVEGVSPSATTGLSAPGGPALAGKYDFNGDGRSDFAYFNGSTWRVAFSNGSGFSSGVDTGITGSTAPRAGRFVASSKDGFLVSSSGTWSYVAYNGVSFSTTPTGAPVALETILTDFDGDGLEDIVWATETAEPGGWIGYVYVRRNITSGSAAFPTFDTTIYTAYQDLLGNLGGNVEIVPQTRCPSLRQCDLNGDGAADLTAVIVKTTGCSSGPGCVPTSRGYDMITGPLGYYLANESPAPQPYLGMDFNDDRCTDTVVLNSLSLRVSGCGLGVATVVTLPGQPRLVMDWDGDGKSDLLVNAGGWFGVYRSRGSTSSPFEGGVATTVPFESNCNYFAADIEGDGLDEIVCASNTTPFTVKYYTHNGAGSAGIGGENVYATQIPDLAINITDGYGVAASPGYVSTSQRNYTKGTDTALPLVDTAEAMVVVGRVTLSDGIGGSYDIDYFYKGARNNGLIGAVGAPGPGVTGSLTEKDAVWGPQGKWAGFEEISLVDGRNGLKVKKTYEQLFPRVGMTKTAETFQSDDTPISSSTSLNLFATIDPTANNRRFFPYIDRIESNEYEVGGARNGHHITNSVRTFTWNHAYGNLLTDTNVVTDKDSASTPSQLNHSWTTTITNTYETALTTAPAWCIGFLSQVQVQQTTSPATNTVTRTTSFEPDSTATDKCRTKVKKIEPLSAKYKVVETFGFDAFGNVASSSVVGLKPGTGSAYVEMDARETIVGWGTTGQFPVSVRDASGATTSFVYNYDVGTLERMLDPNSVPITNVIATTYQYDPFNRRTRERRPDNTYTAWSYSDCASVGCARPVHRLTVVESEHDRNDVLITDRISYFDAFDRPLITRSRLISENTWDGGYQWSEGDYDAFGRAYHQFMPCKTTSVSTSCAVNAVTNSYDLANRLTQQSRPRTQSDLASQSTLYGHAGRTHTTTDAQGKLSTRVTSANGSVRQIKDANNYAIDFAYDAAGSLVGITDGQPIPRLTDVTVEYGVRAFTVRATDSALGATTGTYNSLGELVSWSDASGNQFSATYDALSRMRMRVEPELTTEWNYGNDPSVFNVGKLVNLSTTSGSEIYSEVYSYDSRTRLQGRQIAIPGDSSSYVYSYLYEPDKGWLDTLTYPISTPGYQLALRYGYQNGVVRSVADANSPFTVFWTAGGANAWGQLSKETLGNGVVTNRVYDAVTAWLASIQSGTSGVPTSVQAQSYLYDFVGNVTQRQNDKLTLTESFHYLTGAENLYRLKHSTLGNGTPGDTNLSLTYDLSGNILTKNEADRPARLVAQSICWTSYNYPARIDVGSESAAFSYGPSRQRWRMSYRSNGDANNVDCTGPLNPTQTTLYIGELLEKVTTGSAVTYRHSIHGGDGRVVALYARSGANSALRYVFEDNLGSTESFADSSSGVTSTASFTAHGLRRNPLTWSGEETNASALEDITRQGFTYQTVLGSMGLNHMNGRVQDAETGRFLSADPYITSPGYTQNYNRYSYVYNNPLSLVDPSGFGTECRATPSSTAPGHIVYECPDIAAKPPKPPSDPRNAPGYAFNRATDQFGADVVRGFSTGYPVWANDPRNMGQMPASMVAQSDVIKDDYLFAPWGGWDRFKRDGKHFLTGWVDADNWPGTGPSASLAGLQIPLAAPLSTSARSVSAGAQSIANGPRLAQQLRAEQLSSQFTAAGTLTAEAIANAQLIMSAARLNNPAIPAGFAKYTTTPFPGVLGNWFTTRFYMNPTTGEVLYTLDYKTVLLH